MGRGKSIVMRINDIILLFLKWISYLSGVLMAVIAIIVTINVFTSKIFLFSIPSCNDWVTYLFMGVVYCSCAYVKLGKGGLVSVDFVTAKAPPIYRIVVEIVSDIAGMICFGAFAYYGWELMLTNLKMKTMSSTGSGAFQLWPFNLLLVVGCGVMTLAFIWHIVLIIANKGLPENGTPAQDNQGGDK